MTIFEYIMVMVSIILALALAQLFRALAEFLLSPDRYWVHALWVGILSFVGLQTWWGFWDFNSFERWTFAAYLYVLAIPTLIFVASCVLVPATRAADIDWRVHFLATSRWFFFALAVLIVLGSAGTAIFLATPVFHPYRLFQAFLLGCAIVGIAAKSPRLHGALAVVFGTVFLLSQLVVRMNLGALAGV